jgi:hypothetical protein
VLKWGCIAPKGVGRLHRIQGTMDAALYVRILQECLLPTMAGMGTTRGHMVFQHDNDPKHTAKKTAKWLFDQGIPTLKWPAQSPDLNPIEHVWAELERRLAKYPNRPRIKGELWERLQAEWAKLDTGYITRLYESMPRRVRAVCAAHGGSTKY